MKHSVKVDDIIGFGNEFESESDRGAAIIGAVLLHQRLGQRMRAFFIDDSTKVDDLLEGPLATLGSIASRIRASHCMGLVSEDEYHDLEVIRKIRNMFAHELHALSFSDKKVEDKCAELRLPKRLPRHLDWPPGARNSFMVAVSILWLELGIRALEHQHRVVPSGFGPVETVD